MSRIKQMACASKLLMLLLGLGLNIRITNGRSGVDMERINGPLGGISGDHERSQRDLNSLNLMDSVSPTEEMANKCQVEKVSEEVKEGSLQLKCNGVENLTITLVQIPSQAASKITSITIAHVNSPTLDFDQFHAFPSLLNLSVIYSNISFTKGSLPITLKYLNLSHNALKSMGSFQSTKLLRNQHSTSPTSLEQSTTSSITSNSSFTKSSKFPHNYNAHSESSSSWSSWTPLFRENSSSGESVGGEIDGGGSTNANANEASRDTNDFGTLSRLEVIDLSHNKITELPSSIFHLRGLQSLRLSGNQLKCEFVWDKLWEWSSQMWEDPEQVLSDSSTTFCKVVEGVFQYTVQAVFQARMDLESTCGSVDKTLCHECSLYAFQREGHHPHAAPNTHPNQKKSSNGNGAGGISISIKLDCSFRNLTELPNIPPQTWQLNVSHNLIKDLTKLNLPMYKNLLILDGNSNQVNLQSLVGTPFIEKFNYLNLRNNGISTIPTHILTSLKTNKGQGITFIGENYIDCDCSCVKEIKPLLIENSKRIKDMKDIFCKDVGVGGTDGTSFTRVKDLVYSDVCPIDTSDSDFTSELYLYLIIFGEALLIFLIIAKVWHDKRHFRRTGILPWISAKMPRLPCDAMLESVKEPPNFTRHSGSATSSINVNNQTSISHIQLKDIRSSGSGGGGSAYSSARSSRSNQPHFSGCPSTSSRTSSV